MCLWGTSDTLKCSLTLPRMGDSILHVGRKLSVLKLPKESNVTWHHEIGQIKILITNGTQFNYKETSRGLLGPVAYKWHHCISVRIGFSLKLYAFPKNIVLHNILCETNWIVIRAQFYRLFCEKDIKDRNVPFRPGAILVLNSNDMTSLSASASNTDSTVSGLHSSIRSSDNDSSGLWPPGSLHTLGADGHI